MLSGTRLRGARSKRAQKYTNEETESILVDADAIKVFVETTPHIDRGKLTQEKPGRHNLSTNVNECNAMLSEDKKLKVNLLTAGVLEERNSMPCIFATSSTERLSRTAKNPEFLIEDRGACCNPQTTVKLSNQLSGLKGDFLDRACDKNSRENRNRRKVKLDRFGENLSEIVSDQEELCDGKDYNETNIKFSDSIKKGVKNCNDRQKAPKDYSGFSSEDDLVFSDIFAENEKSTKTSHGQTEKELEFHAKRQQNFRRARSQSDKGLFTDFSFSDKETIGKSTLREFPWGKSTSGISHPGKSTLRDTFSEQECRRSLSLGEKTMRNLYSGKNTAENKMPGEKPPKEDPSKLMEDSEDLVNEMNNSGGDKFTDRQGERSFVCLVDQLTDVRVRQKFVDQHASKRRQGVCEELEKVHTWNDKSLYEDRRDLNIRKALSNMFL